MTCRERIVPSIFPFGFPEMTMLITYVLQLPDQAPVQVSEAVMKLIMFGDQMYRKRDAIASNPWSKPPYTVLRLCANDMGMDII